jgi:IS30 family transposase
VKMSALKLDTDKYFAHLYCSWERGLNENSIGLLLCTCQYIEAN